MGQHRLNRASTRPTRRTSTCRSAIRGPGCPRQLHGSLLTSSVDFAPTIAALAGVALPFPVDGRSLAPLLHGKTPAGWRQVTLLEQFQFATDLNAPDSVLEPPDPQDATVSAYPSHRGCGCRA